MQSLRAPERPVSHYRGGRLRHEADDDARAAGRSWLWFWRRPQAAMPALDQGDAQLKARSKRQDPGFWARVTAAALAKDIHDPSPTRLEYRIERLWLTPIFRLFMRYGLPVFVIVAGTGLFFSSADNRTLVVQTYENLKGRIESRPEFMVSLMSIDGASQPVADAIRAMVTVPLPASSWQLDLDKMRQAIEAIDAVDSVRLRVKAGGVLAVDVVERRPAVLWRTSASLEMLDATGHRVATLLDRKARPDLPVIAGTGAETHVTEALTILAAARPVLPRVRGLVRMGDRRWDLVLDRGQRILLPEDNPVQAVEQVMALESAEDLLGRDIVQVDLRNTDRPTVRLTEAAVVAMKEMSDKEAKVVQE